LTDTILILAARGQVEPMPGFIVGPIARVFGFLIDFLFNMVYFLGSAHSLGFTIILMTIIFRSMMLPLTLKSQKSMIKMRELQPEMNKIKEKYGDTKDPEIVKKRNAEQTALMAKHGANPLSGCLPMLIQMPLFVGLTFIMRQAFLYIGRLRDLYYDLSTAILQVPGLISTAGDTPGKLQQMALPLIPNNILENGARWHNLVVNHGWSPEAAIDEVGEVILLAWPEHLSRVLNRFSMDMWYELYEYIPAAQLPNIQTMVNRLMSIESFFGIHMVEGGGLRWPGILIPLLVGFTMFCSSWLMQQRTHDPNADERARLTQRLMLFVMPIVMMVFTVNFPSGVGIFWITSQVYQVAQDVILMKKDNIPIKIPFLKTAGATAPGDGTIEGKAIEKKSTEAKSSERKASKK